MVAFRRRLCYSSTIFLLLLLSHVHYGSTQSVEEEGSGDDEVAPDTVPPEITLEEEKVDETFFFDETADTTTKNVDTSPKEDVHLMHKMLNRTSIMTHTETKAEEPMLEQEYFFIDTTDTGANILNLINEVSYVKTQLDGFAFCPHYQMTLTFKTDLPNGLLAFFKSDTTDTDRVHQYLYLKNGRVGYRSVVGDKRTTHLTEKEGMHDGEFHTVTLKVSCSDMNVEIVVDDSTESFHVHYIAKIGENVLKSPVELWLGGMATAEILNVKPLLKIRQMRGCLKDIRVSSTNSIVKYNNIAHDGLTYGADCADPCKQSNKCPETAKCINHFSHASCDCFGTGLTGTLCQKKQNSIVTFKGDGYLSHRLYEWRDRAATIPFKASFYFKTTTPNSILLMVHNFYPTENTISLTIDTSGRLKLGGTFTQFIDALHVRVDGVEQRMTELLKNTELEDKVSGEAASSEDKAYDSALVTDDHWHHIVLLYKTTNPLNTGIDPVLYFGHYPNIIDDCHQPKIQGAEKCVSGTASGYSSYFFNEITKDCESFTYTGCGGNGNRYATREQCLKTCQIQGLRSYRPFLGCMKELYVNTVNLQESVADGRSLTSFTGSGDINAQSCKETDSRISQSLSFITNRTAVVIAPMVGLPAHSFQLEFMFKLKTTKDGCRQATTTVLAQGTAMVDDTIAKWTLYFSKNCEYLYYKVDNDAITITSSKTILINDWNKVKLTSNTNTATLTFNEGIDEGVTGPASITYISGVTLGDTHSAMVGCIKHLRVDSVLQDLRQYIDRQHGAVFDQCQVQEPCELHVCEHGGVCHNTAHKQVTCDCSDTSYEGHHCQFPKYLKSCEEYRRHGFNTSGHFLVDYDGEGAGTPVSVWCEFGQDVTITSIGHNVPENYMVRKPGLKTSKVLVNYQNVPEDVLQELVNRAETCSQDIAFTCRKAPLKLSSNTWFSSPQMEMFSNFGTDTPGICACRAKRTCSSNKHACNCDINDRKWRQDVATITNKKHLPITAVNVLQDKKLMTKESRAALNLGELQCDVKVEYWNTVSLLEEKGYIEVPESFEHQHLDSLGFAFRTSASEAIILHKPSMHHSKPDMRILLTSPNSLELQYTSHHYNTSEVFHTSYPLNTAAWQHIWMDFKSGQLRVALNGRKKFIGSSKHEIIRERSGMVGEFYLGATPRDIEGMTFTAPDTRGLVGCFKDLSVNEKPLSLPDLVASSPTLSYTLGCALSCDPNPCQNGAQCLEKPMGGYECVCSNIFAHSGRNCQNNLNTNAVTLLDSDLEMRYRMAELPNANPLTDDITFAFKTRQLQAMLLFALDERQNVLQLTLSSHNTITLLWNTAYMLRSMVVTTGDTLLNQGQEVQIHLHRAPRLIQLSVLTNGQLFTSSSDVGVRLLTKEEYQQYPYGLAPHSELSTYTQPQTVPNKPFLKLFMGGARSTVHAKLLGLRGCLSGLRIGQYDLELRDKNIWKWNRPSFEIGCHSLCHEDSCHNGGRCLDIFRGARAVNCDCSGTSYVGPYCDQEISYNFEGNHTITIQRPTSTFLSSSFEVEVAFAYPAQSSAAGGESPTVNELPDPYTQTLFILKDLSNRQEFLAVGIENSESLVIYVSNSATESISEYTLDLRGVNIQDGYRYYLHLTVDQGDLTVRLNNALYEPSKVMESGGHPPTTLASDDIIVGHVTTVALAVGGTGDFSTTDMYATWTAFTGCISNLRIITADNKIYTPLQDYSQDVRNETSKSHTGLPTRTETCSVFKTSKEKIIAHDYQAYQPRLRMKEVPIAKVQAVPLVIPSTEEVENTNGQTIAKVGKIAAIYLIVVAGAVLIYVYKLKKRTDKPKDIPMATVDPRAPLPTIKEESGSSQKLAANEKKDASAEEPLLGNAFEMETIKSDATNSTKVTIETETQKEEKSDSISSLDKIADELVTATEGDNPEVPAVVIDKSQEQSDEPVNQSDKKDQSDDPVIQIDTKEQPKEAPKEAPPSPPSDDEDNKSTTSKSSSTSRSSCDETEESKKVKRQGSYDIKKE